MTNSTGPAAHHPPPDDAPGSPAVPEPWALPFTLAWEAFRAGSRPVGAVLRAPDGEVVAVGRNRALEASAPAGQLHGANIAHAELNAVAQLPAGRRYRDHRLWTTLEPCLLCSAALMHANVGAVSFASRDRLWTGIEDVPSASPAIAERWPSRQGPAAGPVALFGGLLMDLWRVRREPDAPDDGTDTGHLELARRCAAVDGLLDAPTADAAFRLALPQLAAAT